MRTFPTISSPVEKSSFPQWREEEIEEFLRGANVINQITEHGLHKAVTEAFMLEGYRLGSLSNDLEPFQTIHKISLYVLGNRPHANRRELKKMVRRVMAKIGCRLRAGECRIHTSGRRLVALIFLPQWAWLRPPPA